MEGEATSTISTAIVNMATQIATDAQAMVVAVVPVLAPIVGTIIIATLGYRLVKRFSK